LGVPALAEAVELASSVHVVVSLDEMAEDEELLPTVYVGVRVG
jgi:hypothetical protein